MKEEIKIRFTSLKDGFHTFNYKLGNSFFEHIDYSEIKEAELDVEVSLEKKTTMMILIFEIKGSVKVMCDRCTDDFFIQTESTNELIYRFSDTEYDDEKVIIIYPNEIDIDITHPIYEFTTLALPNKRTHIEGECNEDMIQEMSAYLLVDEKIESTEEDENNENEDIDPRWSALNKLKNKN